MTFKDKLKPLKYALASVLALAALVAGALYGHEWCEKLAEKPEAPVMEESQPAEEPLGFLSLLVPKAYAAEDTTRDRGVPHLRRPVLVDVLHHHRSRVKHRGEIGIPEVRTTAAKSGADAIQYEVCHGLFYAPDRAECGRRYAKHVHHLYWASMHFRRGL